MSRAALLPTPGDPFITAAWLNLYKKVWAPEVNKLYVHLNSRLEDPVMDYVKNMFTEHEADITFTKMWASHGKALKVIYDKCEEDHICLIEDDGYITRKTVVDQCFKKVEEGHFDCVVTTRGSCTESIRLREAQFFGLTGDLFWKPNFWPCFFFSKKETLKDSNNFDTIPSLPTGSYIKELDWTTPEPISMDTFGQVSYELRAKRLKFLHLEDGRSTTEDLWLSKANQGIFANPPIAPWIHFGSTSSGISGSLLDENMRPLENRTVGSPYNLPVMEDDHIKDDNERRISLWILCHRHFPIPLSSPAYSFNKTYGDAIERFINGCDLNRNRLQQYINIYSQLLEPMWKR